MNPVSSKNPNTVCAFNQDLKGLPGPFDPFWITGGNDFTNSIVSTDSLLPLMHLDFKSNAAALECLQTLAIGLERTTGDSGSFLHCGVRGFTPFPEEWIVNDEEIIDYSKRFQLLPTDFWVSTKNKRVKILSYINNLESRKHSGMYESIESVLEMGVPHLEKILTNLLQQSPTRIGVKVEPVDLVGRQLQVIIEMKSIYLTPDNPSYQRSAWHFEGLKNERIVASAIHYYDVENISNSQLALRVQVDSKENYCELGSITAKSNRFVVFPNIYEHIVKPFELEDKTRPGHRDPATRIVSTGDGPPQQQSWYPIKELLGEVEDRQWGFEGLNLDKMSEGGCGG